MKLQRINGRYYADLEGARVAITEEMYRVIKYFNYKEYMIRKDKFHRTVTHKDGHKVRLPSRQISYDAYDLSAQVASHRSNPDHLAAYNALVEELRLAIQLLPESYREVILSIYFKGMLEVEVARMLSVSQGTVSNYKRRAIALLGEYLEDAGYTRIDILAILASK